MQVRAVFEHGTWRRTGRPALLCALIALVLAWIVLGRAPYTSGQFTDFETDTSDAIWMTTHPADIKIVKTSDAAGVFEFTSDIPGCPATFSFTFIEAGSQEWLCNPVDAGTYEVTETTLGWDITIECIESDTANSDSANPPTATINLEAYEKVVCTFTNEIVDTGTLSVALDFSDNAGTGLVVNVTCSDGAAPATNGLTATEAVAADFDIEGLPVAGTTCDAVLDSPPAGYAVDDTSCQDVELSPVAPDDSCTIVLDALGSITIALETTPDTQAMTYTLSPNLASCEPMVLTDTGGGDDQTCSDLTPGLTYTIDQETPSGWFVADIDCGTPDSTVLIGADTDFDFGDEGVSIDLEPGDHVTCTFTTEEPA